MRQMDTILVAVGVPTKEVPGAAFSLAQPVKGTVDAPEKTPSEEQQQAEETGDVTEAAETEETEETGDGWDIPDISDLLDSLNDTESDRNTSPLPPEENGDAESDFNAPCGGAEDNNEHVSWSWDDTHWTADHTHKQRQPNL